VAVQGDPCRSCRVWQCRGTRVGAAVCGSAGGPVQELPCVAVPPGLGQIFSGGVRKRKSAHKGDVFLI
jgi:hypothetical protein